MNLRTHNTSTISALRITTVLAIATATIAGMLVASGQFAAAAPTLKPMNTYFGTTHAHTGGDNSHGSDNSGPADIFNAAKANGFDFLMLTEHAGPTGPQPLANQNTWYANSQQAAADASQNNVFAGFSGYEYSENGGDGDTDQGHMTVYGTTDFIDASAPGKDFDSLYSTIKQERARTPLVFAGFNHPRNDHQAAAASKVAANKWSVVTTETSNSAKYNAGVEAQYYNAYVTMLDRGWIVSPTCGLDNHGKFAITRPESANFKPCRTGLLAPTLNQTSVPWALINRRTYSTRDTNMNIQYSLNNNWMGSRIDRPSMANLNIDVTDPDITDANDKITKIEIVGNGGNIVNSKNFNSHTVNWQPTVNLNSSNDDYLFLRVYNGERTQFTAVTAPVWFK